MKNSWPVTRLGEVLHLETERVAVDAGSTYEMAGVYSFGRGLFRREPVAGANTSYKFFYRLDAEHIVMSQLFGWEGALALSSPEFAGMFVSPQFPTFHCDPDRLDRSFLGWYMRRPAFWQELGTRTKGMGDRRRTLNPDALYECPIPLPPLHEQRRIVVKVEEVAAKIEEARGLRRVSDEHSTALTLSASTQFFLVDPRSPTTARLDSLAERITKGESPSWQGFSYQESGPLFVRSENVLWGKLDLSSCEHISHQFHSKLSRSQLREGDVLVNLVGASIGRSCMVPGDIGDANVNQAVGVITPKRDLLDSSYLVRFLLSVPGQEKIHGGKVETARANISLRDVACLIVPAPPLTEQRRIVAYLDDLQAKVDSLKALQAQSAAELDALLPSILDKAFKGEL